MTDQPVVEPDEAGRDRTINLVSGACLGLLVGLMLGMSVSETVSGVLMALTALLGAFFGLSDIGIKSDNPKRHYRIIGFSLLCVTGIVMGVAVRTSNAFAPSPEAELARWEKIVGRAEAERLVVQRHFGTAASSSESKGEKDKGDRMQLAGSSVLFSGNLQDTCGRLDNDVYTDPAILIDVINREQDDRWRKLAEGIPEGPGQLAGLQAAIRLVCR